MCCFVVLIDWMVIKVLFLSDPIKEVSFLLLLFWTKIKWLYKLISIGIIKHVLINAKNVVSWTYTDIYIYICFCINHSLHLHGPMYIRESLKRNGGTQLHMVYFSLEVCVIDSYPEIFISCILLTSDSAICVKHLSSLCHMIYGIKHHCAVNYGLGDKLSCA